MGASMVPGTEGGLASGELGIKSTVCGIPVYHAGVLGAGLFGCWGVDVLGVS